MLILTEKPSVSKSFASALNVPYKNGRYENAEYCIVNAVGHLMEAAEPDEYKAEWGRPWRLSALPMFPDEFKHNVVESAKKQLDIIKSCFDSRKNDTLLLATDAEREGELIGAEILEYCNFKNYNTAKRFWVSEALTKEVVLKGIENAKPLLDYASYKEQGKAREEADWLTGMNLSRLVTLGLNKTAAVGRVQTAVLAAVYSRGASIANFKKEKYFELRAVLNNFTLKLVNPENNENPSRFDGGSPLLQSAKSALLDIPDITAKIISINKEKKTTPPPQLFNLTALQKEAHKKLNLTPEETLNTAQSLYENHKCLSYPRTPSRVMGDDNIDLIKSVFDKLKNAYKDAAEGADENNISRDNKRLFNSADLQDHHALIPLDVLPDNITDNERGVYYLVLNSFFTTLKPPYVYNAVNVQSDIKGYNFAGNGVEIITPGWKENTAADEDGQIIQNIENDALYPVSSVKLDEKYTEPKKYYTFASILSLMENPRGDDGRRLIGLGTPATRGNILQKLFDRKYLEQKNKNILITEDGKFLIEALSKNASLKPLVSISETTRWEEELHTDTALFLNNIKAFIKNAVENSTFQKIETKKESLGKCPACKNDVYEGKTNFYCSSYKSGCVFKLWKESFGASFTAQDVKDLLAGSPTKLKKAKNKAGKPYDARFILSGVELKPQKEPDKKQELKR